MLTRIRRLAVSLPAIVAACAIAGTAMADGITGGGNGNSCDQTTDICVAQATTPGSPGGAGSGNSGSGSTSGGGGSSGGSGRSTPTAPSMASPPPCTYAPEPTYQPPAGSDPHPTGPGSWYQETCYQYMTASMTAWVPEVSFVWLAAPPPPKAVVPTPAQLAAQAQAELKLSTPMIGSSPGPGSPQMVGLGMWAWVDSAAWSAQSATAAVGGVSVTVTATPVSSTWSFGDGTSLTCGQGTAYAPSYGATASSPTCGHTYQSPGSYTVTVTESWHVGWTGAGQTGTFAAMATTSAEQVVVEASNAIVTR